MSLAQFLPANVFAVMLVFVRVAAALMVMPGFGDAYVPRRYRLLLAVLLAFLLVAVLAPILPALPASPVKLFALIFGEIVIGILLGAVARIMLAALDTAGMVISLQLGLSSAQVFNPSAAQQSALPASLLTVLGVLVIFLTDTHLLMLRALVESYDLFRPGAPPSFGDFADLVAHVVAASFRLGLELAAPFIVLGVVFFVALGFISRLMPQLQVFFVATPLQILCGIAIFGLTMSAVTQGFLAHFVESFSQIFLR
jgi:flagellar biosynthesis protein FliR